MASTGSIHQLAELGVHTVQAGEEVRKQSGRSTNDRGPMGSSSSAGQIHPAAPVTLENCVVIFGNVPTELALAFRPRNESPPVPSKRIRRTPSKPRSSKKPSVDKALVESVDNLLEQLGDGLQASSAVDDLSTRTSGKETEAVLAVGSDLRDNSSNDKELVCSGCGAVWELGATPKCTCPPDDDVERPNRRKGRAHKND